MVTIASYWWLWLIIGIVAIIIIIMSGLVKQLGIKKAFATTDKNCINLENRSVILMNSWQKITVTIIAIGAWILFFISMGAHSKKNSKR